MSESKDQLDRLVNAVLKSRKYRNVCEGLIRHVGARELSNRRNIKEAIKATKNKLHQVGDVYLEARIDYARGLDELRKAFESKDQESFRRVCREMMGLHTSTKERIGILDEFYETTLIGIQPIRVVLDVACGLNPLAIPWMPLDENVVYYAYDAYTDMIGFVQEFMEIAGIQGYAEARDITHALPTQRADLALILKAIPCIEQLDKRAGFRLLEAINADHLLVSFPVHSLSGRNKGMVENYEARFFELIQDKPWFIQRFEFATELAFLITKGRMHTGYAK